MRSVQRGLLEDRAKRSWPAVGCPGPACPGLLCLLAMISGAFLDLQIDFVSLASRDMNECVNE